ncbi:MAG: sn-glycerol-3-phosphate ABC transporter ATP-binding protein UgpC [Erysipelotrichaceae bacterium]|nr:sn-glycerol-3-phosphate ABC transporter ATP-binding protein UgpC [Erysipelotrichaceae bacterium]MBQ1303360.1 sn-glycerol-3-phosphate ABC transporter ATP-binding protein UgpC [Erysipelotrichaceae bacterium]MBQ2213444.1 sn-glycerol-3-phosphate ABC transporter ATP-binding protein UgpC [Erysipelotrichaceae bacterium]MBR6958064.1 sn-glycerol-3-phosphate ABC transporter ATP-binding protein UgpC [Erysipelotrichaceae bacterium]
MASLSLQHIDKIYDNNVQAVYDFNIDIKDGEFIVFVGPSGCGKSTTLRMVAGLEDISAGKLLIDGKDCTTLPAKDRDIAMVFQNYALYGHMTIYENMAFSLMLAKEDKYVIHEKVMAAAEILGLTQVLNRKPNQLSGGQRQRVAMGRAIVRNPKVFLFDEPLSNLDAKLRGSTRREIKLLHKRLGTTMIYVTHDQTEALTLADRIVCMSMGHVQQIGTPLELYDHPKNLFVASFIGLPPMNLFSLKVEDGKYYVEGIETHLPERVVKAIKETNKKEYVIGIRPEDIRLGNDFVLDVNLNENTGHFTLTHGKLFGKTSVAKFRDWQRFDIGDQVKVSFDEEKVHLFDAETTEAIL